ncbi:MAG: peptidoglycan-associated lipoprotein Pal [Acidobacteria bacterium]|nr:peptidoglycan-associated lipoprotein Pal [Acidobacteriota bacterium]
MRVRRSVRMGTILLLVFMVLVLGSCKKKEVPPPPTPPPPPAPPAPTATLRAEPSVIEQGQSSALSWNSTNATDLRLEPGLGSVSPQGSTTVSPQSSTTYTVVATGPGGRAEASTRITVNVPPPPPPPPAPAAPSIEELFRQQIRDAFFDFDKYDIRPDARVALTQSAEFLRRYAQVRVLIEGHCDERGSNEYNIGLGEHRAQAAKRFLVSLGISADRIQTVSYGEERPFCHESNEECWQLNRRAHFVLLR